MIIDNSQLSCFCDCPRRYYNRYILKLRKRVEDDRDINLNFGSAIHKALEAYYKGKQREEVLKAFNDSFNPLEGNKVMTPANGILLLEGYIDYYTYNTNELSDTNMQTLAVEVKDIIKLTNDLEWLVKIDRIVKNNAGIWVVDHKTTQKSLYTFFDNFTPNTQVSGYVSYAKQKYGQCSGFIPNVLSFGTRERAYKGEPAGFHYQFQRDIVNRTNEQLEDFKVNVTQWVGKLQQAITTNIFPKNENQCGRCGFRELCSSCDDKEVQEVVYETYDPTAYLND